MRSRQSANLYPPSSDVPALAISVLAIGVAMALGLAGSHSYDKSWSIATHMTARLALAVLGLLFCWRVLPDGFKKRFSPRALGLSYALIQLAHLVCLVVFHAITSREYNATVVAFGAPVFIILAVMTAISVARGKQPLSPKLARFFNLSIWFFWLVSILTYVNITLQGLELVKGTLGLAFCILLLVFRLYGKRKNNSMKVAL